ncbi:MAG: hypothetical protein JNK15_08170 [Planctomycetes bacterium]|nr:hypothetical protein [Planctomycetota bacterium]
MSRRASEWSERVAALAIVALALVAVHDVRARVVAAGAELDDRERRLERIAAWSERADGGLLAAEDSAAPMFPGYRLVPQASAAGVHLVLVPQEPSR